ncbi:MAG: hypothetical protein RMI94_12675 [Bryobacterales bacterium]|nr:hypothetical protein [Bryobacterales bacterium]
MVRWHRFLTFVCLLLGVCWLLAPPLQAQAGFQCSASTTGVAVRAEGLAELVGDLILTCTGGVAGQSLTMSVHVYANANITSRILNPPDGTEALLLIGNPPYGPASVVQGVMRGPRTLVFSPVRVSLPGTGTLTLKIVNVRVNATQVALASHVMLSVVATAETSIPIVNPIQQVAVSQTGMTMQVRKPDDSASDVPSLLNCTGHNTTLLAGGDYPAPPASGGRTFNLKFIEGFSSAFRPPAGEQGTVIDTLPPPLNRAGLADHGTRLRAVFTNVPRDVAIFVTVRQVLQGTSTGITAECITTAGGPGSPCPVHSSADGGMYRVPLTGVPGTGEVYWEIKSSSAAVLETISFGVAVAYNPGPPAGMGNVLGTFSPISTAGEATTGPNDLPRFIATASPVPGFTIEVCRSVLLFHFVTSIPGWDTGIAVTNTTRDSPLFNTAGQSGKCTAYFYHSVPTTTVPPLESPVIPAGGQWLWTVHSVRPNFQGYMLVSCEFQHAYGFAFISDLGFSGPDRFAQAYQAVLLDGRTRMPIPQ